VIAYFGTGMLGSGFVRKMLERGETVHVWNRSPEKAHALEPDGAVAFTDPAQAVRGASALHLTLSDDDAVDSVLARVTGALGPDTLVIDHTTTAPVPTGERARRLQKAGVTFIHAPVFMGPANARAGTGLILLSGDPAVRARVRPLLEPMTGKVVELGDDPARAASFKLFGNLMLLVISGGLADMYKLGRALGISPADAYTVFADFNPGGTIGGRGKAMSEGNFDPSFELTMGRKDLRLMMDAASGGGATLDVVPALAALFDRYIEAGFGARDVGVIASPLP